mmetsp:Transcript_91033/g.253454  ORF Transcript_91033/g.253454 Transcript_91033/m.253454 type:complete len:323 (+) Transcript_91033:145-1113(+)
MPGPAAAAGRNGGPAVAAPRSQWDALEQDLADALEAAEAPLLRPRRSALRITHVGDEPCHCRLGVRGDATAYQSSSDWFRCSGLLRTISVDRALSSRAHSALGFADTEEPEVAYVAQEEAPLRERLGGVAQLGAHCRWEATARRSSWLIATGRDGTAAERFRRGGASSGASSASPLPVRPMARAVAEPGHSAHAAAARDARTAFLRAWRLSQRQLASEQVFNTEPLGARPAAQQPSTPRRLPCGAVAARLDSCTAVARFGTSFVSVGAEASTSLECAICFELFQEGEYLRILPCLHRYHVQCVDPWLASRWNCPLCKHELAR